MLLVKWLGIADRYSKMYLDRVLAPLGINSSQHMYITIICRNPGITQEQFTEMTHLNPSNITRALNALISKKINEQRRQTAKLPVPDSKGICG